jgi:hypothetical protein
MKKCTLIILVLLSLAGCTSVKCQYRSVVGKKYINLSEISTFANCQITQEVLLKTQDETDYRLTFLSKADSIIILFGKLIQAGEKFKIEIIDILAISNVMTEEILCCQDCMKDTFNDSEIFAVAKHEENQEQFTAIHKAWRADRKSGKLKTIKTDGIRCMNEGFGIE